MLSVVLAVLVGGCVEAPPGPSPSPPAPTEPAAPAEPLLVAWGLLGPNVTLNESLVYFVNSTAPVAVTLRLNGSIAASETITGNKTWRLPLRYGQTPLNVSIAAPGFRQTENVTLVRLGSTSLRIDYCHYHPSSTTTRKVQDYTILIDVDSRPSEPLYRKANAKHIDAFTAHDQIYLFEQITKIPVEVQYFSSLQGFAVNKIDGVGNPATSSAPPYWLYKVNGSDATGMSLQVIEPADKVVWALTCAG